MNNLLSSDGELASGKYVSSRVNTSQESQTITKQDVFKNTSTWNYKKKKKALKGIRDLS